MLFSKAAVIAADHWTAADPFGNPQRASVSGLMIFAADGTNCLQKLNRPRYA